VLCDSPSDYPATARASVLKVRGSEIQQRLNELAADALGMSSMRFFSREEGYTEPPDDPLWPGYVTGVTADLLYQRALTIYGGAKEVQKNIIAKLAFGF
jgi:alkylation response protein AidB-like acyl-CoA dehydrogenase